MIDIPKPYMFYALGGGNPNLTPLGLRRNMLSADKANAFWDHQEAIAPHIGGVILHRMEGEANPHDAMDFDSAHSIELYINEKKHEHELVLGYYKTMRRRAMRFAHDHKEIELIFYMSSLQCHSMDTLRVDRNRKEWDRRWEMQIGYVLELIDNGCNVRLAFDEASTFSPDSVAWAEIKRLAAWYPGKVIIEALPSINNIEQSLMPTIAMEQLYQRRKYDTTSSLHDVTRVYNERYGNDETMSEFITDCAKLGHRAAIYDMRLGTRTIEQVRTHATEYANRPTEIE